MNIVHLSVQGSSPWNEDELVVKEELGVYGVIDGATSLVPFRGAGGETGGYIAAGIIAGTMHRLLDDSGTRQPAFPLTDALLEANRLLREEMMKHGIRTDRKEELWSGGGAVIRLTDTAVHYAQAGDCMLTAVYTDGTIRFVTRDQIAYRTARRTGSGRRASPRDWRPAMRSSRMCCRRSCGEGSRRTRPPATQS
ncbi:hypothetical protein BG53_07190 [Paenibacillus darwinianus]|uniref:PPM-type phosphatase domain-containing protein n=1 Tax=Paenibacillus darwinianus TaxID=1380763 RepID=A0A9W5W6A0_9BACL|nr:hypothetical protein [Paenibacillus darwinianus]EXX85941.1 hypothetical protein CH50_08345 [Paenibacillus darwinianus]EXX86004.1 hypothetical protein BG53_07190 [Paenibacillus darwinianus]EXX86104.1 hypothetical protein BG52_07150 [Paenibacillus darwinianus]